MQSIRKAAGAILLTLTLNFISVIGESLRYEINLCKETFDDHANLLLVH